MKDIDLSVYFKQDDQGNPCLETMKASELCRRADEHVGEWVGKRTETGRMMHELTGCIRRYMELVPEEQAPIACSPRPPLQSAPDTVPGEKKPIEVPPKLAIEEDGSGNPRIVVLRTKTDQERSNCIAKLGQLFDEAKNGSMRDVLIISFRQGSLVTMHWTEMTDENGFRFVGALNVMAQMLAARMRLTTHDDNHR
jgi:hypothetical protein